ncbi:hypothetical protein [Geodermatophilus sp. SYSU D00710]
MTSGTVTPGTAPSGTAPSAGRCAARRPTSSARSAASAAARRSASWTSRTTHRSGSTARSGLPGGHAAAMNSSVEGSGPIAANSSSRDTGVPS